MKFIRDHRLRAPLALAFTMLATGAFSQQTGDIERNPLPSFVASSLNESIRSQLLDPTEAKIDIIVHFPSGRGENGRICGEVTEPGPDGPRIRTFYATYTRAGRVLARFEPMRFSEFLERDTVFRNCRPRL